MGYFGKKGKGGQEQDLAHYSTERLEELIEHCRFKMANAPLKSIKQRWRQDLRKYEYVLSRRGDS